MNIFKRIKNIWQLGGQEITQIGITKDGRPFHAFGEPTEEKPRMATIIKMNDPVKDVLEQ